MDDTTDEQDFEEARNFFTGIGKRNQTIFSEAPRHPSGPSSTVSCTSTDTVSKYFSRKRTCSTDDRLPSRHSLTQPARPGQSTALVSVSSICADYQSIYPFSHFNRLQSSCFSDLVQTNDNLVISAPTASGKTVLMELAMCRLFESRHSRGPVPKLRALYLAPLKSLCIEKSTDWQTRFSACGLRCTKVIGGETTSSNQATYSADPPLAESHIICATPEKWISQMRDSRADKAHSIFQSIKLVLIDECHMVGSDRSAALEIAVAQIRYICSNPRFVATLATIGNIGDIACWLSKSCSGDGIQSSPAKTLVFGEEYRAVPLSKTVLGFTCNAPYYKFQRNLDFKLPRIINTHCPDKPVLIFCSTRGSAQDTCRFLSRNIDQLRCKPTTMYLSSKFTNGILNETIPLGVAFHHAGLSSGDRQRIENLFSSGSIRILCSTSTLGIGVNLPAHAVIVKGTKGYAEGDYTEYSTSEILQFIGRAGRPQFGSSGKAIILTDSTMVRKYQTMVSGQDILESSLQQRIPQAILTGVYNHYMRTVGDVARWLSCSFLAIRAFKAPARYGQPVVNDKEPTVHVALTHFATYEIDRLCHIGLLSRDRNHQAYLEDEIAVSALGKCVAKYDVDPIRMAQVLCSESLPLTPSYKDIIDIICSSGEFEDIRITAGQKSVLNEMNKSPWLRFKVPHRVQSISDKVLILIQYGLECQQIPPGKHAASLSQDISRTMRIALGPAMCIRSYYIEKDNAQGVVYATRICRELAAQCSETVPAVLQQIEGIGPRYAATLWKLGVKSIPALLKMTTRDIEYHLGRNPPFGTHVLSSAKLLCVCSVDVELYWVDEHSIVFTIRLACNVDDAIGQSTAKRRLTKTAAFTLLVYTKEEPMLLLKFEQLELSSEGAFFETQIGLCNPVPRSTVIVEVAPETFVGCCERTEIEIPDYDCAEPETLPDSSIKLASDDDGVKIDLDMYDEYLEELLASDAKDVLSEPFE